MQLIIFIGLQGAGKSTFYHSHFADTHLRLNRDMLKTKHRESLLFKACLNSKTPTVIDKTNPTIAERRIYIQQALAHKFEVVAYYFDVPFEEALMRNNQRIVKSKVPEVGLKSVAKQMQKPTFDEGFSQIYVVQLQDNDFIITEQD